jgi:hypothetical protein
MTSFLTAVFLVVGFAGWQLGRLFSYAFFDSEDWDKYAVLYLACSVSMFSVAAFFGFLAVKQAFPFVM